MKTEFIKKMHKQIETNNVKRMKKKNRRSYFGFTLIWINRKYDLLIQRNRMKVAASKNQ